MAHARGARRKNEGEPWRVAQGFTGRRHGCHEDFGSVFLGRRSISNILQHLGGRSRHIFNQYLGGRPAISICWPECPPLPLKTPSKWRLKPTEPAPICAQTSRHCVHTLSDPPESRLSLAEDRPQAGGEIFGQHINTLSTFRRELRSQHVNMLSIFRHDVVNIPPSNTQTGC